MWADDAVSEGVITEEERDIVYLYVADEPGLVEFALQHCAEAIPVATGYRGYGMPLNKEIAAGKKPAQAAAIAYDKAGKGKK